MVDEVEEEIDIVDDEGESVPDVVAPGAEDEDLSTDDDEIAVADADLDAEDREGESR